MEMLGARVHTAMSGQRTLKEAVDEALEMWVNEPETFYVLGSAVGPHPYPLMVRHFQSVIGSEARAQMLEFAGRLPDVAMACVGGGSNAIGLFAGFVDDADVRLIGVEPAGRGLTYGDHAASLCKGDPGVMHGFHSYMIKDEKGEDVRITHANYIPLMMERDRGVRAAAFEGLYTTYQSFASTIPALYDASVRADIFSARTEAS